MIRGPAEKRARSPHGANERRRSSDNTCSAHAAQIVPLPGVRPCVLCGVFVGNLNLGGHTGRSAFTGELFCLNCADRGVHERSESHGGQS